MNGKIIYNILGHMDAHCDEISEAFKHFGSDFDTFTSNRLFKNAVSMSLMQIGELVGKFPLEFLEANQQIPWREMRGMRNMFAHAYQTMNDKKIWDTATNDIPKLKAFCNGYLSEAVEKEQAINDELEM